MHNSTAVKTLGTREPQAQLSSSSRINRCKTLRSPRGSGAWWVAWPGTGWVESPACFRGDPKESAPPRQCWRAGAGWWRLAS